MLPTPAALRTLAALAACLSLSPALARGAPPPGPFAEPPPGEPDDPVEPFAEPPPDDDGPRRRVVEIVEPPDDPLVAAERTTHPLVVSIFAPASTNAGQPVETYLEINALYGQVGALRGVSAGAFGRVDGPAWGLRLGALANAQTADDESGGLWVAGLANVARGDLAGLHLAGLLNRSAAFDGVAIAGGVNLAAGPARGAQLALGANVATRGLSGLQIGGLFNHASHGSGAQLGPINVAAGELGGLALGALNLALEDFGGAQLGALNYAGEADDSLQLGAVNAARELEGGLQVGVINYARGFVRGGLQLGLVNVAPRGEGTQVGLVSVGERLAVEPLAWGSWGRGSTYAAGLRLRNGAPYSQLFFAYAPGGDRDRAGAGAALGARVSPEGPFSVDLDAAYTYLARAEPGDRPEHRPALRASLGLDVNEHFGFFFGASGGARVRGGDARPAVEGFAGLHF
ncbi:MAG TPA: hypothetical protein VFS43_09040 [Polyangiaceae bacterium]|nr:hypothetical protein [Polyangiaceae bacterium]